MTWTTSPPSGPGWFWLRQPSDPPGHEPAVVRVNLDRDSFAYVDSRTSIHYCDALVGCWWAGPLVPPEDS